MSPDITFPMSGDPLLPMLGDRKFSNTTLQGATRKTRMLRIKACGLYKRSQFINTFKFIKGKFFAGGG